GWVMVRSQADGPTVLGGGGRRLLDGDVIDGPDPLAGFGPFAADDLRRHDRLAHTPDLLVNSLHDPETGEVAAFEELVGCHGGLGWYGPGGQPVPTPFRGIGPAWGDVNLREVARVTSSGLFLAHIRASTGTPVQQSNCHPFRYGRWLWCHNGSIKNFRELRRD